MQETINKTMNRQDLFTDEAQLIIRDLNCLILDLNRQGMYTSSWVGTLPSLESIPTKPKNLFSRIIQEFLSRKVDKSRKKQNSSIINKEIPALRRGMEQRLNYKPLDGAADDLRIPWFLNWEILWVLKVTRPYLRPGSRIFDGGGTSSLFSFYIASQGYEIHTVDLNEKLKKNGDLIAKTMNWNMHSYLMNLRMMEFPDEYFDHAYSICVFEHLDYDIKRAALAEIARCLKPGGVFSITFDYRNPAPKIFGIGKDPSPRNSLKSVEDIHRNLIDKDRFELIGNPDFMDNGESYLMHPDFDNAPYTFGAIFMRKK